MEELHEVCCGLDVHKASVTACLRKGTAREVRTFRTVTAELLALGDWLAQAGCTHVAMESTGVYWKPIYNLLEGRFHLLLVNARHLKAVPGRKTDVLDAEWIAQLLAHGLLSASFVPPPPIRELRELTRHRTKLIQQHSAVINRIQKVLEDANIKLASVASNVVGVSGRAMLAALVQGETEAATLAELAKGRLREKLAELKEALEGRLREHHRFLLEEYLLQLAFLEERIARVSQRIEEQMRPFLPALERLDTIPGVDLAVAEAILAEVGPTLSNFPDPAHLGAWACVCPGAEESAGKRRSGKTRKGNRWLRGVLAQAAWAASRTKNTYLASFYHRIARRRGKKRAIVALSRAILEIVYHVLKEGRVYQELGADFYDRLHVERLKHNLILRLQSFGLEVTVTPAKAAA